MAGTVRTDLSRPGSVAKHQAILEAAEEIFLRAGYLGTNMDEVAVRSGVSKQTVYKHFGSKETLFVDLVTAMTSSAGDRVLHDHVVPDDAIEVARHLEAYAERQLSVVLTPKLLQLRRLVIGEVERFPDLAQALYASGPGGRWTPRPPCSGSSPGAACSPSTTRWLPHHSSTGSSWASR